MIDLYRTLEVPPGASDEEVKRAYRRIALLCHPDRNPCSGPDAEDRFKEINFAYSVLGDRQRRRRYDLYREFMERSTRWGVPPSPAQERVLGHLFLDPKLPDLGRWLDRILETSGFSGNARVFRTFSREPLRLFRRAVQEERRRRAARERVRRPAIASYPRVLLKKFGTAFLPSFALRSSGRTARRIRFPGSQDPSDPVRSAGRRGPDIEWTLPLTREEATRGTRMTVSFFRDDQWDRLLLLVPPDTREGVRLRVRNKGNRLASGETGDLYLRVMIR